MPNIQLNKVEKQELLKYLEDYAERISKKEKLEVEKKLEKKVLKILKKKKLAHFILKMISQIKDLDSLISKNEISVRKRNQIIAALHYFVVSEDKIPDYIPVVGYLDDAFIISTVHDNLKNELELLEVK